MDITKEREDGGWGGDWDAVIWAEELRSGRK